MPKKKVIAERNLEHWTKFTTQIKDKKQIPVFLTRQFCNNSRISGIGLGQVVGVLVFISAGEQGVRARM